MYSKEYLINYPLLVVKDLIENEPSLLGNLDEVSTYFSKHLEDYVREIPSLNERNLQEIKPLSLVRFRGMIQDMFDPELFLGKYECVDRNNRQTKLSKLGVFTDSLLDPSLEINHQAEGNVTLERQTFHCVPVPGENMWLKSLFRNNSAKGLEEITVKREVNKRRLSNDESSMEISDQTIPIVNVDEEEKSSHTSEKLPRIHEINTASTLNPKKGEQVEDKLSFHRKFMPLPDDKEPCCFVKFYSDKHKLKLNDIVEFICVLTVDPDLGIQTEKHENAFNPFPDAKEEEAHCPPPSLVPRIHCIFFNKIETCKILPAINKIGYENVCQEISSVRNELLQLATKMFGGDSLVAEYFILHLISKTYGRVGTFCLGKMSLNITNCPEIFISCLYEFISLITQRSIFLPLSLKNLNEKAFVPKKNFELNRLLSGMLQLADETNLVIDETQMQPGQLNTEGVKNLTAIGNVMQWEKLEYDFQYSKIEIETNVNVLILSQAKSILTCDFLIPLQPTEALLSFDVSQIEPKLLEKFQLYFSAVNNIKYALTEEVQKALEEDFVQARKENPNENTADSFHQLLITARCMALSYGQETLSSSLWCKVKELDNQRRKRVVSK